MTVREIWNLIRFNWAVLLLAASLGAGLGALSADASQPEYTAKADVFVAVKSSEGTTDMAQGATYSQQQARNFAEVATRRVVLLSVIDDLSLDSTVSQLRDRVSTTVPIDTSLISISVVDPSAARAAAIANGVGRSLAEEVPRLVPRASDGTTPIRVELVEQATPPRSPSSPHTSLRVLLGAVLALMAALVAVAVRDVLRGKVLSPEQASSVVRAPLIGVITNERDLPRHPMVRPDSAAGSLRAEQYRQVRTNLRFLQMDRGHKSFVITSAVSGEAKSTTAANLAATLASDGVRVCLVEADLRKPSLAAMLDLEGGVGLTTVLAGEATLDEVLQPWGSDGLLVLLAGERPPNPSELLGSQRAEVVLTAVRDRFDVIIVDAPPLLPVTDATILARLSAGALMVVSERKVEVMDLRRAVERLAMVNAPVLGTIVTMSREGGAAKRYYDGYVTGGGSPSVRTPSSPQDRSDSAGAPVKKGSGSAPPSAPTTAVGSGQVKPKEGPKTVGSQSLP